MYKKFVSNLAFLLLLNVLVKPFWIFGIDRGVQNAVGTEQYGVYFALFNYVFLFHILLDFGINNFNNRAIARQPDLLGSYLPSIIGLKGLLAALYVCVCFAGAWWLGYDPFQLHLLLFMCANQILLSYILYFRSNLAGLHLFKRDGLLSILDRALMIAICAALLWGNVAPGPFRIEWFVYAQTAAYALAALTSFALAVRQRRRFAGSAAGKGQGLVRQIFKDSYPFALLGLLMSLYNRMDAVMLEYLLPWTGATESGVYAMGYRLLDAANMLGLLFAALLLPMFSRMIAKGENVAPLAGFGGRLLFAVSTVVALCCHFYQNELMGLLYPAADGYTAEVFGYLMPAYVAISSVYVYGTLLTANGSLKQLNAIAFSGVVLNFALNCWLIPTSGALGAAAATLFTQFAVAAAHLLAAVWLLKLPAKPPDVFWPLVFTLAAWAIIYAMTRSGLPWQARLAASLVGGFAAALPLVLQGFGNFKQQMSNQS